MKKGRATKIKVTCNGCGVAYEMPNIGVTPIMEECPNCMDKPKFEEQRFRGGKMLGELRKFVSHFEQDVLCSFVGKQVTIVINKNGLVVCRNWKKCEHHGKEINKLGIIVACPEKDFRDYFRGKNRRR